MEDKATWEELCEYVKLEILGYDSKMKFPKDLALKLQGLKKGQFIANNKAKINAQYDNFTLLCTFKLCKQRIVNYISNNDKIKNEKHKINTIMKIIEPEVNDMYIRLNERELSIKKIESINVENHYNNSAKYTKKTNETKQKFEDLW